MASTQVRELKNIQKVRSLGEILNELEKLDKEWVVEGVPAEYSAIWVPQNEIRLWSVPRTTGQLLKMLILINQPKIILEVGTSAGYSALWMASAANTYGGQVHTIEATKPKIEMAMHYFKKANLDHIIHQIHGMAANVLNSFEEKVDFLFMDADKSNYREYLQIIEPKLHPGSVIVADNACDFGYLMQDFLDYLQTSKDYEAEVISMDHGLLIATRV